MVDRVHVLVIVQRQTDGCSLSCKDGAVVWQSFGQLAAGCLTILEMAVDDRRCPHFLVHFGAINTLRQDNASLQQRLESCEHRLQTLEKAMVDGAHRDTTVDGVQNTTTEDGVNNTSVGNAHNSISVGSAHNSTPVGDAHNPTSVGDAPTSSVSTANMASQTEHGNTSGPYASVSPQLHKAKRPTDAPSYIYRQSPNPKKKVELNRKGPSSIPVTSPITKPAELRNHRKITTKQTRT